MLIPAVSSDLGGRGGRLGVGGHELQTSSLLSGKGANLSRSVSHLESFLYYSGLTVHLSFLGQDSFCFRQLCSEFILGTNEGISRPIFFLSLFFGCLGLVLALCCSPSGDFILGLNITHALCSVGVGKGRGLVGSAVLNTKIC